MMDRLTVMGCLEGLTQDDWQQWYSDSEVQETAKAVLALLKEQEAVEPTVSGIEEHDGHGSWWYQCGKCKMPIDYGDRFCRRCGQAVKWNANQQCQGNPEVEQREDR